MIQNPEINGNLVILIKSHMKPYYTREDACYYQEARDEKSGRLDRAGESDRRSEERFKK